MSTRRPLTSNLSGGLEPDAVGGGAARARARRSIPASARTSRRPRKASSCGSTPARTITSAGGDRASGAPRHADRALPLRGNATSTVADASGTSCLRTSRSPRHLDPTAGGAAGAGLLRLTMHFDQAVNLRASGSTAPISAARPTCSQPFEATEAREAFPLDEPASRSTGTDLWCRRRWSRSPTFRSPREPPAACHGRFATSPPSVVSVAMASPVRVRAGQTLTRLASSPRGARARSPRRRAATPSSCAPRRYFGRPYPLSQARSSSRCRVRYGAMENPGLLTFADSTGCASRRVTPAASPMCRGRARDRPHLVRRSGYQAVVGRLVLNEPSPTGWRTDHRRGPSRL